MAAAEERAEFSLFGAEEQALAQAETLLAALEGTSDPVRAGVVALLEAYRRAVRDQRQLVKVSDRQQAQLGLLNQELARRSHEAEDALARLRETQETLIQAETLASLGGLVAGVAHEINTPVGIALTCASHLADVTARLRGSFETQTLSAEAFEHYMDTARDTASLILANCERAAGLIRSFKQVAVDRTSSERRPYDLASTIAETLDSLRPKLRQSGLRTLVLCPSDLVIDGYPGALSQILANFAMNSLIHAYEPAQAGTITIEAESVPDDRIRLVYRDDGKGIAPEHRSHVFEPFFTTRRGQGGTGLGLHVVYNLVTGPLQGTVTVASEPGAGTAFTLLFPRVVGTE